MPIDLNNFVETLRSGFGQIPPIVIALILLGGPTGAMIVYRLLRVARRMQSTAPVEVAPLWVCQDCRSVNQLRLARCYRCGTARDDTDEIEVLLDQPAAHPASFQVPAGSPFAAPGSAASSRPSDAGPGVPVMGDPSLPVDPVPVGPGREVEAEEFDEVTSASDLRPTAEHRR
jgi:hypothetical protein